MKSILEQGFFNKFTFDNKMFLKKHSSNFESVKNDQSSNVVEFELRHISIEH